METKVEFQVIVSEELWLVMENGVLIVSQNMNRVIRSPAKTAPMAPPAYKSEVRFCNESRTCTAYKVAITAAIWKSNPNK